MSFRKILFLDIDGVLNSQGRVLSDQHQDMRDFDPVAIDLLNGIVVATGCEIVISSSWRKNRTIEKLQEIFKDVGFHCPERIIGKTGVFFDWIKPGFHVPSIRGLEIKVWLDLNVRKTPTGFDNNQYNYCILDDDSDMLLEQKDNFVKTATWHGLTEHCAKEVIKILNG